MQLLKLSERFEMAKTTEHPILGRLIPDQLGEDLMLFRKFPDMKIFWHPDSKKQLEDLEPQHRELVKQWDKQPGELPQYCRNYDVLAALQSLGVYEIGISQSQDAGLPAPTDAQLTSWNHFIGNEQDICRRAQDAVVKYFNLIREADPELFKDEDDCPESADTIEDLLACVRFDGMNLNPDSVDGMSTISFGWDVDWDMEHGLQMVLCDGQVIGMGNDLYGPEDILSPRNFYQDILNDEERAAYKKFSAAVSL